MQQIKIEKRIAEELDGLRKLAAFLPKGKVNSLQNKCAKIYSYARKAQAMVDSPVYRITASQSAFYDARTEDDMVSQAKCQKAVFNALLGGRKIDLRNAAEFRVSQMHTTIAKIRRDIYRQHPELTLCDEWIRPEGTRPYKRYWIIKNEINND